MHPILAHRGRRLPYLAAWLPVAALLTALAVTTGRAPLAEALVLALPLTYLLAFLTLAAWYPCRALPLAATSPTRLLVSHTLAAAFTAAVWGAVGAGVASLLDGMPGLVGLRERSAGLFPVALAVAALLYLVAVGVHYAIIAFEHARKAEREALERAMSARDAELRALRAQIDPHFLFNSLNAVAGLTVCDPTAAREMCLQLADFFRSTVSLGARNTVTLREELALVRSFLAIEKVRFGARIAVEEDVEEAVLACTVPPLLLHPLVENAVTHGIATLLDGGTVRIVARGGAERVVIEVENPRDRDATAKRGAGVGLANVRQRLAQHYGGDAWLSVREEPDLFRVTLSLPASGPSAQASGGAQ